MTVLAIIFFINFGVLGLVFWRTAGAARRGSLKRNQLLGIRTRATMASDEAWKRAHDYAAPHLARLGGLCFAFCGSQLLLGSSLLNLDENALKVVGIAQLVVAIGILLFMSYKADAVAKSTPLR